MIGFVLCSTDSLTVWIEPATGFQSLRASRGSRRSNSQIEIAFAGLASKLVLGAIATAGWLQLSDHFIDDPATRTLEIVSTDRHVAAKALQRAWFAI
jgi:hypothetical protein